MTWSHLQEPNMKLTKILFILFLLLSTSSSLLARDALPPLVEKGEVFDPKTYKENFYIDKSSRVNSVAISSDGKTIVSGSYDNSVKIWERASGELLKTLEGHKGWVTSVAISNDGKTIVSGSVDKSVKIWDRASGKLLKTLEGHTNGVNSISISTDGKTIVSGSGDNSVKIWERASGKLLKTLEGHTESVSSVAISTDGKTIVSGSNDNSVKIWDRASGKLLKELWGGRDGCWQSMDFEATPPVFYGGDDGTLLYERNGSSLKLALPKLPREDSVKFLNNNESLSTINEQAYPYGLTVQNSADRPLYWIKTAYHDDYCTLLEQRVSNLKAKAEQNLTLNFNCSLPRENPKPIIDHKITLYFTTATKSEFTLPLLVSIRYADINVTKAEVSEDGKNLNIVIQNSGNEDLKNAKIKLLKPFNADRQDLTLLEVNTTKTFSYALPLDENKKPIELDENATVELKVFIPNVKLEKKNPKVEVAPSTVWHVENVTIVLNELAWYIYALWAVGTLLLLALILYYKILKSPLIQELSENPNRLKSLDESQLKEASFKLRLINQLESTLALAEIEKEDFRNTLKFIKGSNDEKAKIFAKQIGANEPTKENDFYRIKFSEDFKLNSMKTFLLYFSDEHTKNIKSKIVNMNDKVFVIAKTEQQNSIAKEAEEKTNRIVAPTVAELTELLLSANGQEKFIAILAKCLSFKDVSPYQLKSVVKSEANFFGRIEILREIISNDNSTNYLLVGARQLGKSSILKALERRYLESEQVVCYYFILSEDDVLASMADALGLDLNSNIEQISKAIKAHKKKPIFLIDEADKFVKHEKDSDYLITSVFRKLSQEDDAMFILAGFWTLYEYVTLDYQSPLQNFGKLMVLGGLEEESCRELMIEPMRRLGITYESESIIDETIKVCGYRANYIATVCDEVLKGLETSVITKSDVEEALESIAVNDMLQGWAKLTNKLVENRHDRFIVYFSIGKESFRLSDIVNAMETFELSVDVEEVNRSLERLVLAYILTEKKGNYSYLISLFKERLLEKDLDELLKGTVNEMKVSKQS